MITNPISLSNGSDGIKWIDLSVEDGVVWYENLNRVVTAIIFINAALGEQSALVAVDFENRVCTHSGSDEITISEVNWDEEYVVFEFHPESVISASVLENPGISFPQG